MRMLHFPRKAHWLSGLVCLVLLGCSTTTVVKDEKEPAAKEPAAQGESEDVSHSRNGESGRFDYYVLSLSWSPQFCATRNSPPDDPQCGNSRRYGFVVHGLWPQYETGYPESCPCPHKLEEPTRNQMLGIMPSHRLIEHEWQKHGTCSGLSADQYFEHVRNLHSGLIIPEPFREPKAKVLTSVNEIKRRFVESNPQLREDCLAVQCSGNYLNELRICLSRDLKPKACSRFVRDRCKKTEIELRPLSEVTISSSP